MPDVNSLVLNVQSDSVTKASTSLDQLVRASERAERAQRGLASSSQVSATASVSNTRAATGNTTATVANAEANTAGAAANTAHASAIGKKTVAQDLATVATNRATASFAAFGAVTAPVLVTIGLLTAGFLTLGKTVSVAADLEKSLSGVEAVTGATASEMKSLEAVARSLGKNTVFSAGQAADGMRFLGMAGFETNEIIAAMPGLLDLAAAGQLELAEASDIASNVLSGFRLEAEETGRVSDILAKTAASSNTSVQQLGNGMSYAAPIAASLGISIEETAAAIGVLSNAGIQGQRAGTGLRTAMAALSAVTPEAERTLKELGLTVEDVDPQLNSLTDILRKLEGAGIDASAAFEIFGREGAPALLAITSQVDEFERMNAALESADGSAKKMADTLSTNLHGSYKKLGSAASEFFLTLDDTIKASELWGAFIDDLTGGINSLSAAIKKFSGAPENMEEAVDTYDRLNKMVERGIKLTSQQKRELNAATKAVSEMTSAEIGLARKRVDLNSDIKAYEKSLLVSNMQLERYTEESRKATGAEKERLDLVVESYKASIGYNEALIASNQLKIKALDEEISKLDELETRATQLKSVVRVIQSDIALSQFDMPTASRPNRVLLSIESDQEEIADIQRDISLVESQIAKEKELQSVKNRSNVQNRVTVPDTSDEFEALMQQMRSEEQIIQESYERRTELILLNTQAGSISQLAMLKWADEQRVAALEKLDDGLSASQERQLESLVSSLETERELYASHFEEMRSKRQEQFEQDQELLQLGYDENIIAQENFQTLSQENWERYEQDLTEITRREAIARKQAQLKNYSSVVAMAGDLTGALAGLAKEGTAAQKALFVASKGIAIAQGIVNTEQAYLQALADPTNPSVFGKIPVATAIRALGYASVGIIAGQAVAGVASGNFATGGIIPGASYTGDRMTANVNSGEMILNRSQQMRLFDIANGSAQGGGNVSIAINNYSGQPIEQRRTQTPDGEMIEIIVGRAEERVANTIRTGDGIVPRALESSYQGIRRGAA